MIFSKPETRWGAFGIHLVISALIFIVLAAIIVFIWYPGFLFQADGGWQGIRLIASIDLILGPVLTLIIYNKAKKSLPVDLAAIGVVQLIALFIGCYLVYQERPIAVIYSDDSFRTMSKKSYDFYGIDANTITFFDNETKPVWVYVDQKSIKNKSTQKETKPPAPFNTDFLETKYYRALDNNINKIQQNGLLTIDNETVLHEEGNKRYFKFISKYYEGFLLFDFEKKKVLKSYLINRTDFSGISTQ